MNKIYHFLLAAIAATTVASCSSDELSTDVQDIKMPSEWRFKMDINKPSFDGTTRATNAGWEQGDSLFLRFTKTDGYAYSVAEYDASTADWVVKDAPSLDLEETKKLEIAFFNGCKTVDGQTVTLSPTTALYTDDGNATYLLSVTNNFVPVIKGHLVPRTARLRFKGDVGTTMTVRGLKRYSSFNTSTLAATTSGDITLTVGADGYSPYYYCSFADNERKLSIAQDITVGTADYRYTFTTTCPSTMLQTGKSGWMNLPTNNSHDGWEMKAEVLSGTINDHRFIDLGLSVKWATCNVGASKPEDSGNYYAWGEIATKSDYSWATYLKDQGGTMTSYINCGTSQDPLRSYVYPNNKSIAGTQYDAARTNWGGTWRMPSYDEMYELIAKCTTKWTTQGGVYGRKMTGPNGKSIFLPAAGYKDGTTLNGGLSSGRPYGRYWTSSPNASTVGEARGLCFMSDNFYMISYYRCNGHPVRPVSE